MKAGASSSFRRASCLVAFYFAMLWWSVAEEHRLVGSLLVLVVGLSLSAVLFRPIRGSQSGSSGVWAHARDDATPLVFDAPPEELELAERQRARFFGALGHELRNPLNSVTGFSDMLLGGVDGALNSEQERSVRTIRASAERLLRLVSTVVDQARIEAKMLRLQPQWVAPQELVSEAIEFVRSRVDDSTVVGAVSEGLPRVFVDRHRTIHSLVSLAVMVMRSSETDISFRVGPPRRDQVGKGFVQFDLMTSIKDPSSGTPAVAERLREASSPSDALGLEVAVAKSVIRLQGGRIWTEAGTAGSLRVCITLPTSSS